jgi:rhamnosyltransferase
MSASLGAPGSTAPEPQPLSPDLGAKQPASWPEATIALLTKDPGSLELETLELLRRQNYSGGTKLVVIDSSADTSAPPNLKLREASDHWEAIPPDSFRHAGTRNKALDACRTPVIVYLSGDAHPVSRDWLATLVRPLACGQAHASYGRQQSPVPDPEREATFRFLYPQNPEIKTKDSVPQLGLRTFHFSDVTSAFLTDVLRRFRFPEELPIFEDIGIAKRLLDEGCRIAYVPDAVVLHSHELRPREILERYRKIGYIYERLGIFDDLRRARGSSLLREGVKIARDVSSGNGTRRRMRVRGATIGGLKLAAVALGRWQCRREHAAQSS